MQFVLDFECDGAITDADYSERITTMLRDVIRAVGESTETFGDLRDEAGNKIGQWEIV